MDSLTEQLFLFEGDNQIKLFNGNYSEYRESKREAELDKRQAPAKTEKVAEPAAKVKTENTQKLSYKEKKEIEDLEKEIPQLTKEKKKLEDKMAKGDGSADDFAQWGKELKELTDLLDEKEMRWLELTEY